jgi:PRTRC genetic system protein C
MEIATLKRTFTFNGINLQDPNPQYTVEQVKDFFIAIYPDLLNAEIEGPVTKGETLAYTFKRAVGTKGETTSEEGADDDAAGPDPITGNEVGDEYAVVIRADYNGRKFKKVHFAHNHHDLDQTRELLALLRARKPHKFVELWALIDDQRFLEHYDEEGNSMDPDLTVGNEYAVVTRDDDDWNSRKFKKVRLASDYRSLDETKELLRRRRLAKPDGFVELWALINE